MIALLHLSGRPDVMGAFANRRVVRGVAWLATSIVLTLNLILLLQTFGFDLTLPAGV
jgi:manganese transport protein